jgi:hypothetical protein
LKLFARSARAINYDFAEEFKDEFLELGLKIILSGVDETFTDEDPLQKSLYYWMTKYAELLENYNALLKQQHQLKAYEPDYKEQDRSSVR